MKRALVSGMLAVTLMLTAASSVVATAEENLAAEPFLLYMSTTGSASNTGLTPASPLPTLEAVESRLLEYSPQTDVEIHIEPGTYVAPETVWTTYVYGHSISFMPSGYSFGDPRPTMPVFRSDDTTGYWLRARLEPADQGGTTDLRFYYLMVSGYSYGGLKIEGPIGSPNGIRIPTRNGMNGNTIYGMRFDRIGEIHNASGDIGYGGLTLQNSDDNWVRNNHFTRLENSYYWRHEIHGIYLAHGADDNLIESNAFSEINGGPIRVRNTSDDNVIRNNTFTNTGYAPMGFYSEWFCGEHCLVTYPDTDPECGSFGNQFYENTLGPSYPGTTLGQQYRMPADLTEIGRPGCVRDSQEPWLRTWDNIRP